MLYDTIFNYSHLCHCLHSFKFLQQKTAWILLLHGSYWQHYLSLKSLLFILISQCRALGPIDIFPLLFADSKGRWCLTSGGVISSSGGEHSCSMMDSYHLVVVRTASFPFSSQPPQTLHGPAFLPCCPRGYQLPRVWCPGISPSVPKSPSTLGPVLLPPNISPPYPPCSSSSSVSKSYNHWPSLYSSPLFPPAAQAHTADLVSQVPRGTLQPALLFGDQAKKDFCGSELEHVWPRWDF